MQVQISWLLQKPTDLDLHCLQMQGICGLSRIRLNAIYQFFIKLFLDNEMFIFEGYGAFNNRICKTYQSASIFSVRILYRSDHGHTSWCWLYDTTRHIKRCSCLYGCKAYLRRWRIIRTLCLNPPGFLKLNKTLSKHIIACKDNNIALKARITAADDNLFFWLLFVVVVFAFVLFKANKTYISKQIRL